MQKVALITGGSRGIGLAIAHRLSQDGFAVSLVGTKVLEDTKLDLSGFSSPVQYICADISSKEDRMRIVSEVVKAFGRIDVLVNNAGVAPLNRTSLLEMEEDSFDRVIGINTKGNLFLTQLVSKQMLSQPQAFTKRGTIINIGSCSAEVSSTNRGEYCVSKAGVAMLTTLFADALASEGILVHEVRPGVIATDMTSVVKAKYDALIDEGIFPIKRWGQPEDVANAVSAFASDLFLYTTGNYIDVDGGFHIKRL